LAQRPLIFGCSGPTLNDWERAFFAESDPHGFILFKRNCETPEQVAALTGALRDCVGRPDAPVLVDQEGGRVQRLGPPNWRPMPAAARFGALAARDAGAGREAVALNARLLGDELAACGISADCAPVLDLSYPETHGVIGDRAFGTSPQLVADLGRAVCDGLAAAGVLPIIKHIPGHGRARVDSHLELPRVKADRADLEANDFVPFRALADAPWAMTAHIVFEAIDPERPATVSPRVIEDVVRGSIGFEGVIVSDDLSMQALSGSLGERAQSALAAGCDLALHCNGEPDDMVELAAAVGDMPVASEARLARAAAKLPAAPARLDTDERRDMRAKLEALMAPVLDPAVAGIEIEGLRKASS
jgi:beta-N-acetylhexosaminidase